MKKVSVSSLKPGVSFDQPVYIDKDSLFLQRNEAITLSTLEQLKKWNISELMTEGSQIQSFKISNSLSSMSREEKVEIQEIERQTRRMLSRRIDFIKLFDQGKKVINQAYDSIAHEKLYDINRIRKLAEEISIEISDYPRCFLNIYYFEHEPVLAQHVVSAAFFGGILAQAIGFSKPKVIEAIYSILFMDVGMGKIPFSIRDKKGTITDEERKTIQAHTIHGYKLLTQDVKLKNNLALAALQHHENFDGSGYPRKIKMYEVAEYSRIAGIVDSFTAMLENKTYSPLKTPYHAMKDLLTMSLGRYDPKYLKAFCNRISIYPIGSLVELSDGSIGVTIQPLPDKPMRPFIFILRNKDNNIPGRPLIVSLMHHTDKYIKKALKPAEVKISPIVEMERIFESVR